MADLDSSYKKIDEKSKSFATYKQVKDDIATIKKRIGSSFDQFDRNIQKGLDDNPSNLSKSYQTQTKNQFERLLDIAKFNPSGKGGESASPTMKYIKKALIQTANRSGPKITKILQEEMIKALGCSEQEQYIPGMEVIVPIWTFDLFKQLKITPDSKLGKTFYEKSDSTTIGISPFSLNRSFYYATQTTNPDYFNSNFGSSYLGASTQSLFDITFNPNTPLPAPFNYTTEAFTVKLSSTRNNYNISQFLSDYFKKIQVIDSKNILTQIIEILTGSISIELKSDLTEQSKFILFLRRILGLCFDFDREIGVSGIGKIPEIDAIDGSFFELTDIDLRTIDERITNIQLGVAEFTDCDNLKFPVDTDSLLDLINQMNFISDPNKEDEVINSLTQTLLQSPNWPFITGIELKIDDDILKSLPIAVVLALLTPKVVFPFIVMSLALGKTFVYDLTTLTEFLKQNIKMMIGMVSRIFSIFVKELFDVIVKDLKYLTQLVITDLARNRLTKRYTMILSLIELVLLISRATTDYRRCRSVVDDILQILSLSSRNTPFSIPTPLLGLSTLRSGFDNSRAFVNVIEEYQKLGLPTGPLPDGSPNLMIISKYAEINGVQKEDVENGVVKVLSPTGIVLSGIKA